MKKLLPLLLLCSVASAQTYYDKTTIPPKIPAYTVPINPTNATAAPALVTDYRVNCTNGSTGAADATLIANALTAAGAATGGVVRLVGACKVNAQLTIPSGVTLDGQGQLFTIAAAANWSGGTIKSPLHCADSGHDITVTHFNADLTTNGLGSTKLLSCQGDTIPTTYTRIHFTDNYVLTPGDGVALNSVSDSTVTGNYIAGGVAGAAIDYWSTGDNAIITGNTVTVGTGAGIAIIYTAFNTDNATRTKKQYANISHNHIELAAASGVGEGIYLQNLGTCSLGVNGGANDIVADNTIHLADGKAGIAIWSDFCNYNSRISGNVIVGDGVTVQTHPAIEVSGASSGIQVEGNLAYGWLAPTVGSDSGVFANKGENGSIINNKCFSCSALLVGATSVKATTIIYGNDDGSGTVTFTSPVTHTGSTVLNGTTTGTGLDAYALAYLAAGHPGAFSTLSASGAVSGAGMLAFLAAGNPVAASSLSSTSAPTVNGVASSVNLFNWGVPVGIPPSGFFANNGVYVIGQVPSSSATLSVSGTSGSVTATFSAATLLGTAADVGRVITLLDTTYKYCTITAQSTTTVATCTISGGSWSGTGPFANANLKISGTPTTNTSAFSVPLNAVYASAYMYFPVNVISAATAAGVYYVTCQSTTVCTVFNNALASGTPTVPGSPTAFSVTGTGAFTQSISIQTLLTLTIPGNSLGPNGSLVYDVLGVRNSNADTIALEPFWNGIQVAQLSVVSVVWYGLHRTIRNLGVTNVQSIYCATCAAAPTDFTTANNATSYLAQDTTANLNLTMKAILSTAATDWFFLQGGTVTVNYAL